MSISSTSHHMADRIEATQRLLLQIEGHESKGELQEAGKKRREMARICEEYAKDLLDKEDPAGWIDLYAAITAWGKAGDVDQAERLIQEGRDRASRLTEDASKNIHEQLSELADWLHEACSEPQPS